MTREIPRVSRCQSCTALWEGCEAGRCQEKEALAKATAALAGAEDHHRDLVDRRKALAPSEKEKEGTFTWKTIYDMETDRVGARWQADKRGNSRQNSWWQSEWKEDDRASPEPSQPSLEIEMLKSMMAEAQQTQYAFQQSMMVEKAKFQQAVVGILGKMREEAQRAPSTPAGTGAIHTKPRLEREETSGGRGGEYIPNIKSALEKKRTLILKIKKHERRNHYIKKKIADVFGVFYAKLYDDDEENMTEAEAEVESETKLYDDDEEKVTKTEG